jgi:hypothetical protein
MTQLGVASREPAKLTLLCFTKDVSSRHDTNRPATPSGSGVDAYGLFPRNGSGARALETCGRNARRITRRLDSSGRRCGGHP